MFIRKYLQKMFKKSVLFEGLTVRQKNKLLQNINCIKVKVKTNMLLCINCALFSGLDPCPFQILAALLQDLVLPVSILFDTRKRFLKKTRSSVAYYFLNHIMSGPTVPYIKNMKNFVIACSIFLKLLNIVQINKSNQTSLNFQE